MLPYTKYGVNSARNGCIVSLMYECENFGQLSILQHLFNADMMKWTRTYHPSDNIHFYVHIIWVHIIYVQIDYFRMTRV